MSAGAAAYVALAVFVPAQAFAQASSDIIERTDIPAAVKDQVDCGTEPESIVRRPFAGGFVFAWDCPGNNANAVQALVFAASADGAGALLLKFPTPKTKRGRGPSTELSNVRWFPKAREVMEISVDPEGGGICRTEGRWRLDGQPPKPVLVGWRQTRDCQGRRGWVTIK